MKKILSPFINTALTIIILSWALPTISFLNWTTLIIASIVLTLLQKVIKPIMSLILLPINIVTLGLFSWVINVFILYLATYLVPGLNIDPMTIMGINLNGFMSLLVVSFLISFVQSLIRWIV